MSYEKLNHTHIWAELVDANEKVAKNSGKPGNLDAQACRLALGMYKFYCFCERLREEYDSPWLDMSAVDVARLYLINKHHWFPTQVKDLGPSSLLPLLQVEIVKLRLSEQEVEPVKNWAGHLGAWPELLAACQPGAA